MLPLHQKYGPWNLEVAPWFRQVEAAMSLRGEIPASMGGNDVTSKFITMHFNTEDRVAMVDYRPDVPVLPKSMPQ
ncbi:unnamed protein product [Allacma fusca]|nr:unnamed protein product [Allacma fusca]